MNNEQQNQGTLVNVKRVRRAQDKSGREQVVLTVGLDKEGNNTADALIETQQTNKGKQINFDVRLEVKQTTTGQTFDSAFVIVKEMIPRDANATYTPKANAKQTSVKANADKIRKQFE